MIEENENLSQSLDISPFQDQNSEWLITKHPSIGLCSHYCAYIAWLVLSSIKVYVTIEWSMLNQAMIQRSVRQWHHRATKSMNLI